jgi:hypothetical protein
MLNHFTEKGDSFVRKIYASAKGDDFLTAYLNRLCKISFGSTASASSSSSSSSSSHLPLTCSYLQFMSLSFLHFFSCNRKNHHPNNTRNSHIHRDASVRRNSSSAVTSPSFIHDNSHLFSHWNHHHSHHKTEKTKEKEDIRLLKSNCQIKTNVKKEEFQTFQFLLISGYERCFGGVKELRHKNLGFAHLDKSIYIDQLLRWLLTFHSKHFIFILSDDFFSFPSHMMKLLYLKLLSSPFSSPSLPLSSKGQTISEKKQNKGIKEENLLRIESVLNYEEKHLYHPNSLFSPSSSTHNNISQSILTSYYHYFQIYNSFLSLFLMKDHSPED